MEGLSPEPADEPAVVGGSAWDIVRLFTVEFVRLVALANVIAWPVAYFLMQRWLSGFAYRIDLGLAVFVTSALAALAIAWATVAAVTVRTARAIRSGRCVMSRRRGRETMMRAARRST